MRRKKLAAGEIRFRVSTDDRKRIDWLLRHTEHESISGMIRILINKYYQQRTTGETNDGTTQESR